MRTLLHVALITLVFMALPTGLSVLFRGTAARFLAATPIVIVIRTGAGFIVVLHRSSAIATVRMFSAFAADLGHVLAVRAYRLTALATCLTRFVGIELMRNPFHKRPARPHWRSPVDVPGPSIQIRDWKYPFLPLSCTPWNLWLLKVRR